MYEISAEQQKTPAPYLGKTIRPEVEDRMKDRDHRAKTLDGAPPKAKILAHELTPDEAAGVEALLIKQRGLENLSNKIHGLDVDLPKNQEKIRAGKRVLGQE